MLREQSVFSEPYERVFKGLPPDLLLRWQAVIDLPSDNQLDGRQCRAGHDPSQDQGLLVTHKNIRVANLTLKLGGGEWNVNESQFSGVRKKHRSLPSLSVTLF
jgi:hypothetical protein